MYKLLMAIFVILLCLTSYGQKSEFESFDDEQWQEVIKDIDYTQEEQEDEEEEEKPSKSFTSIPSGGFNVGPTLQVVVIALFVIVLVIIISKIVGNNLKIKHKNISHENAMSLDEIEENLMEADLFKWLKKAVSDKDYKLALRIYYLIIIKELAETGLIKWRKEKTNMDYLLEMRSQNNYDQFEELTRIYEVVWYGEKNFEDDRLKSMSFKFKNYFELLKGNANG